MDQERIFLSAVSSEFGAARQALARTLRVPGNEVREQSDFGADPRGVTLLDKLHAYIRDCTLVVCLIGERSGGRPSASEAEAYRVMLPEGIVQDGFADWSYTQWEVFFALHFRARQGAPDIVTIQAKKYQPEKPGVADELQSRFVAWQLSRGIDLSTKAHDARQFEIEVLRSIRALREGGGGPKPIHPDIHSIGELFTGRDDFLDRLRTSLTRQNGTISAIRALRGLGGIGKTCAAMEYALRHRNDYTALLFVRAYDPATLDRELAALTGVLRLPERDATDDNVRKDAVLRWLAAHPGWLLILDNVDTPEALRAATALARSLRSGHVVMTSRLEGLFAQDIETLELGLLTPGDAVAYLLKATEGRRRPEDDAAARARELAEALDHLTLALVHAGAYIAERRFTFARYLEEWRGNRDRVLYWAAPDVTGYPLSLAQTWITSMDQLTPAGRALLERLSFFANDPVPEFLLDVAVPGADSAEGMDPLLDLQRFSLVTRDAEADRFTIHRVVRDATNRRLATSPAARISRLTEALGWINAAFVGEPGDVRSWPRLDALAPHAETLARAADSACIADPTARLMNQLAVLFNAKAAHTRAESLMRRALAIDEASFGGEHPEVAIDLNNLAQLLRATNRLGEAEPLMRRALAIDEASFGGEHPKVARDLNNLALLLQATNRLGEAEPLMRHALAIFCALEAAIGRSHPSREMAQDNYADLLAAMGKNETEIAASIAAVRREAGLPVSDP